ncbi:MAG: methylated-DNA--[protein]-cysteine S-methyltransferase [Bacteroidota bacterium]
METYSDQINTPVGTLEILSSEEEIISVQFINDPKPIRIDNQTPKILADGKRQLIEYFDGRRKEFDLKLNPTGTDFQQKVWEEIQKIDFGRTESYLNLARSYGDEKSIRAVAAANGKNPIAVIIPCHRIIGSNNELTGYAGGIHRKRWLLEHEFSTVSNTRQGNLFDDVKDHTDQSNKLKTP